MILSSLKSLHSTLSAHATFPALISITSSTKHSNTQSILSTYLGKPLVIHQRADKDNTTMEWDDETLASEPEDETCSVNSYVFNYEEENGRTYHSYNPGKYWGANDESAQDHEELCHHLWYQTFHRHLVCPDNRRYEQVLDLGTGVGHWAQDIADQSPHTVFTGLDLSPIQLRDVSPNVFFVVDDIEQDFNYDNNKFDLIHIRGLDGSIRNWPRLYAECLRCLKPGGIIEHAEYSHFFTSRDNSIPQDGAITR